LVETQGPVLDGAQSTEHAQFDQHFVAPVLATNGGFD